MMVVNSPPLPRVRLVGRLDMLDLSHDKFSIKLDDGRLLACVLVRGDIEDLAPMMATAVVIDAKITYLQNLTPWKLLVNVIVPASGDEDPSWKRLPDPPTPRKMKPSERLPGPRCSSNKLTPEQMEQLSQPRKSTNELSFDIGEWPDDEDETDYETDEELAEYLKFFKM